MEAAEGGREEIGWPVGAVCRGPGSLWRAVEAVDEDDVDFGFRVGVDGSCFVAGNVALGGLLGLFLW